MEDIKQTQLSQNNDCVLALIEMKICPSKGEI